MVQAIARDARVLDEVRAAGQLSVTELAARLDVGAATVRRSLQRLASDGHVIRTYGGAALPGSGFGRGLGSAGPDEQTPHRRAIGAEAASLVSDGATVALSSGSTVLELAARLRHRRLTVITTSLDVAVLLVDAPSIELVMVGGIVLPRVHGMRGHLAESALRDLRADTAFMGASAIDLDHGFMTEQVQEIPVDRALRAIAREAVVLADASKFDRVAPGFMFGFDQVGTLVTDVRVRPEVVAALEGRGTRVIRAGGDPH